MRDLGGITMNVPNVSSDQLFGAVEAGVRRGMLPLTYPAEKPVCFRGDEMDVFADFYPDLEAYVSYAGWSATKAASQLPSFLTAHVLNWLRGKAPAVKTNYDVCIKMLDERWSPAKAARRTKEVLNQCTRGNATLTAYGDEIENLVRKAYPGAHPDRTRKRLRESFVRGLDGWLPNEMSKAVIVKNDPSLTLESLVDMAIEMEKHRKENANRDRVSKNLE